MTICYFSAQYLPTVGGVERYTWNLARRTVAAGHRAIVVTSALPNLPEHEIKIILNRYLFPASEWDKSCRKLSGGEKMRLAFCCLMISNNMPDMFILDEPTNNLDIQSIEIITATIKNYAGTVIAISHDNYFIQEIGVEQSIFLS